MPSLQGYEVQTHQLSDGREIDVLHAPDDDQHIWVPGQQLARLTGDGRRSTGRYSTSDMGRLIDKKYQLRVPDPHRLYSQTRALSTTLFAVEGLIQRTFHTSRDAYLNFCYEFIARVLPAYVAFGDRHAELLVAWYRMLYLVVATDDDLVGATFHAAVQARDYRLKTYPTAQPVLVIGTANCNQALYRAADGTSCLSANRFNAETLASPVMSFEVTQLCAAHVATFEYRDRRQDASPIAAQLALAYSDGTINLPDGKHVVRPVVVASPGGKTDKQADAKAGPTADDVRQALLSILRGELPGIVEPIVLKAVRAHVEHGDLADLVKAMTENVTQLVEITVINREQLELSRQSIDLITPSHQMFLSAKDYVEADGVTDALRRAPKLAEPSFGLDHCTDYGKASLWMKRLCRAENRKVAMNAVARIIAKDAGEEEPPLYIPEFRMKRLEREHVKVLVFNPACWARCKQTFLLAGTPTLLFPGPKTKAAPDADPKAKQV